MNLNPEDRLRLLASLSEDAKASAVNDGRGWGRFAIGTIYSFAASALFRSIAAEGRRKEKERISRRLGSLSEE